ncbi:MAG TPA: hypothetical protein VGR66_12125, partial [Candidatus Eisenbacteria bacterium]|nr:hypothetical protein [Candidatus Eisenbacteria bacterium]
MRRLLSIALLSLLPHGSARATVGGPDVSSLLGYERRTGKIYFEVTSFSEGPGTLIYSIPADSIGRIPPQPWPQPQLPPNDYKLHDQWTKSTIDSLRAALVQPDTLPRARARLVSSTLQVSTFRASDEYFRRPEFSLQVRLSILALS